MQKGLATASELAVTAGQLLLRHYEPDLKGMQLRSDSPQLRHLNGIIASNGTIHDRVAEALNYA